MMAVAWNNLADRGSIYCRQGALRKPLGGAASLACTEVRFEPEKFALRSWRAGNPARTLHRCVRRGGCSRSRDVPRDVADCVADSCERVLSVLSVLSVLPGPVGPFVRGAPGCDETMTGPCSPGVVTQWPKFRRRRRPSVRTAEWRVAAFRMQGGRPGPLAVVTAATTAPVRIVDPGRTRLR
jgi:hypothetical protein